jgi:hypothetical protein
VNPCTFGLSPKFSTPVEKAVENRPKSRSHPFSATAGEKPPKARCGGS